MDFIRQLKEVTLSVLPIGLFATILSFMLGVMDGSQLAAFVVSCVLVIMGLTFSCQWEAG